VYYIRNNTYLIKDKNLRKNIYIYLFKKDVFLQNLKYIQQKVYEEQDDNQISGLKKTSFSKYCRIRCFKESSNRFK
jgi:hypothetical protein